MQLFTDEELGVKSIPLPVSIIKDLTQSDTLSSFFDKKAAPPYLYWLLSRLFKRIVF